MYQTEQKEARYVAERVKVRAIIDAQEKKIGKELDGELLKKRRLNREYNNKYLM